MTLRSFLSILKYPFMTIHTNYDMILCPFLHIFTDVKRLNIWHFTTLVAILILGYRQLHKQKIKVRRSEIMALSHIKKIPTYHKYSKELQYFGYIEYFPSYYPGVRSEVNLR